MSYSFSAKGATKIELLADAAAKLDAVIESQPIHSRDREAALANLRTHLDLIDDPASNEDVVVSMNGSISMTNPTAGPSRVTNASSGCSIYLSARAQA